MQEDIRIRIANSENLNALTHLAAAFRDGLSRVVPPDEDLRQSIDFLLGDKLTEFFLAVDGDERCVGYIQQRYRYSAWLSALEAYLEDLFVIPEARRRHVGLGLAEFAIARAAAKGCRLIELNTNEGNGAAVALYKRLGFLCERECWKGGRQLWFDKALLSKAANNSFNRTAS